MTKGWPSDSCSFCATTRAAMSVAWPGGHGTTTRTGRVGYACAKAAPAVRRAIKNAMKRFIRRVLRLLQPDIRVPDDFAVAILLAPHELRHLLGGARNRVEANVCLLYTSDAADERSSVDLGG